MSDEDWKILGPHLQERRIPIATDVRMVLVEYMKTAVASLLKSLRSLGGVTPFQGSQVQRN
jgi:hypothetical protein